MPCFPSDAPSSIFSEQQDSAAIRAEHNVPRRFNPQKNRKPLEKEIIKEEVLTG